VISRLSSTISKLVICSSQLFFVDPWLRLISNKTADSSHCRAISWQVVFVSVAQDIYKIMLGEFKKEFHLIKFLTNICIKQDYFLEDYFASS